MAHFALASHLCAALLYLGLTGLLLRSLRGRAEGVLLIAASGATALWAGAVALRLHEPALSPALPQGLEVLRNLAWLAFLARLSGVKLGRGDGTRQNLTRFSYGVLGVGLLTLVAVLASPLEVFSEAGVGPGGQYAVLGLLALAVAGLVAVEQLFRNASTEERWALKFLCIGIGGLFAYDFFLYADALLFRRVDARLWGARGFILAMIVPLLVVSASRNETWSVRLFVSKRVVFHSAALVGAGLYLLVMAGVGYYVRAFGGSWGVAVQAIFFFGAAMLLVVLLFSGQVRANLKFFLNRNFFAYKYDYREEWLRFIGALSEAADGPALRDRVVQAIADIVESPGGVLWLETAPGSYQPAAHAGMARPEAGPEPASSSLVAFLKEQERVIEVDEHRKGRGDYAGLTLPPWLEGMDKAWLVLPLMHVDDLVGFLVLMRSRAVFRLTWEDVDLLKTVGRQAGSYLMLMKTSEALADARQFEVYNRLSAFVVHDLKNIVAQLSLVVRNSRRHLDNPEFVADAIHTVEHAVDKMNRMLEQLRKNKREVGKRRLLQVREVVDEVVRFRARGEPPVKVVQESADIAVVSDRERLANVLGHLVQNAQEATRGDQPVEVRLGRERGQALVEVCDQGEGMSPEFVRDELFKPFVTTKGNAGMGIGVFEARTFVEGEGGEIRVESTPGAGTRFLVLLPLAPAGAGEVAERLQQEEQTVGEDES